MILRIVIDLCTISAAFWILTWLFGLIAAAFSTTLEEEPRTWFIIIYKIILAVIFSSLVILLLSNEAVSWWYYILAFVFVFFTLGSAYTDEQTRRIDDLSALGFIAGLLGFIIFAVFPILLSNPITSVIYSMIAWILGSWLGWIIGLFVLYKVGSYILGFGFIAIILIFTPFVLLWGKLRGKEN